MKSSLKQSALFLLISFIVSIPIYLDGMRGVSLLAPLDLGPFVFEHYKFMAEDPVEIPDNHFIIDQFTYDLPLQKRIYDSYREGEIPWWDPYTYGGRPLLADAHINGTDPVRVILYMSLPFELAYNWNLILKGLITGLGMFLLLRHAGVRLSVAVILGITYQYSGWFTMHFGHPWIQASFAYFPFIWLAWLKALSSKHIGIPCGISAVLCALVFYSGNLQSHTYLPIFVVIYLLSEFIATRKFPIKSLIITGLSGTIGALLAYPVLINQLEFYSLSSRLVGDDTKLIGYLATLPTSIISAVFPWALGTFRSLQPARGLGVGSIEFHLFAGVLTSILLFIGWRTRKQSSSTHFNLTCTSITLFLTYLIIVCTPLSSILYARSAALAGMGMIILAGIALEKLLNNQIQIRHKTLLAYGSLIAFISLSASLFAWLVYPHLLAKITPFVLQAYSNSKSLTGTDAFLPLRNFQIKNLASEISLQNPEIVISLAALLLFIYAVLKAPDKSRNWMMISSLAISSIPVLLFHARFKPSHDIAMWHKMEKGGDLQIAGTEIAGSQLRIDESAKPSNEIIFPHALAALYKVHAVQGYSALQPVSLFNTKATDYPALSPNLWKADLLTIPSGLENNSSKKNADGSRFVTENTAQAIPVELVSETMNSLTIQLPSDHEKSAFIRTDTWYPGWRVSSSTNIKKVEPCFTRVEPSVNNIISFKYTPTGYRGALPSILSGMTAIVLLLILHVLSLSKIGKMNLTDNDASL